MTVVEGPRSAGLIARAQNMILKPAEEWDVIAAESATIPGLFTGYVLILAAIPPVASIIGTLLFAHGLLIPTIIIAVLSYALSIVGVFVLGFVVDALASSFDGQRSQIEAMKLVAYSYTAAWVAGVLNIIPLIGWLGALVGGLYSLYTLYLGFPKLMKSPQEKTVGYFVVTIVVAIVINMAVGLVIGMIAGMAMLGAAATGAAALGSMPH